MQHYLISVDFDKLVVWEGGKLIAKSKNGGGADLAKEEDCGLVS